MILKTRHTLAKTTAERWEHQYRGDRRETYNKLLALGSNPDPDEVDKIIGNKSWTRCGCEVCFTDADIVGVASNYVHIWVCKSCLESALGMFKAKQ